MNLQLEKIPQESEIVRGLKAGEARVQKELFQRYSGRMKAICIRYLKDPDTAQDVMITAFMKVFEKIGQFQEQGSLEGWIKRIMVNESLGYLRKNKTMYLEMDIEMADREPDYQSLSSHLEAEDLLKMVASLPIGYRTVFNMYAIEGYSHKEIAEELGINENTSKSQLSRARAHLQKMLLYAEQNLNRNVR